MESGFTLCGAPPSRDRETKGRLERMLILQTVGSEK